MRFAIVTPTLSYGDAVSNDVLGMRDALRARGYTADAFAEVVHIPDATFPAMTDLDPIMTDPANVLIYHHSMGWRHGMDLLRETRSKVVVKYHNITPPEFFTGYSRELERVCRVGREELPKLAALPVDLFLADSEYNRRELIAVGAPEEKSAVLAPFHQVPRLLATEPDPETAHRLRDGTRTILIVGRVVPNKGHATAIEAFAELTRSCPWPCRLLVVGREDGRLRGYSDFLRDIIERERLGGRVEFVGGVDDATLRTLYESADAFFITSEHEGFCVPLVEAMALGVPIVALGTTAVPETLSEAGICWEENDPGLFAQSLATVLDEPETADFLRRLGRERYAAHFAPEAIERRFLELLNVLK